jgi:hypothetical protein
MTLSRVNNVQTELPCGLQCLLGPGDHIPDFFEDVVVSALNLTESMVIEEVPLHVNYDERG